jgi:protein-S-isoprenylcysteine O-methyltransferase Ste14
MVYSRQVTPEGLAVGAALVFLGILVRVWAVSYTGTSVKRQRLEMGELVVAGPYRHVRNPLYLGNILLALGVWVATGAPVLPQGMVLALFLSAGYTIIVAAEEHRLLRAHPEDGRLYLQSVSRWMPQLRAAGERTGHQANWIAGIWGERWTMAGYGAGLAVIGIFGQGKGYFG